MNGSGVIVVVFIGIAFLLVLIRLGTSMISTRRMSGQGHWSADGAEIPGLEARAADRRSHHTPSHNHNAGHHNAGHHNNGGGHIGGGGGHHG